MSGNGRFQQLEEGNASSAAAPVKAGQGSVKKPAAAAAPADAKGDGLSSIPMASFNLSNAIIGAGVGGMPYALKEAGFYSGVLLMCLVATCSDYSVRLLVSMGQKVNKHYYEQLVQSVFGKKGYVAVSAAMGIFAYGAMVAYLIGIGDTMSIVVSHWAGIDLHKEPWLKRAVLVSLAVGAVLPLAMLRNMASLSKTSFLSLMSVVFIVGVVISRAIGGPGDAKVPTTAEDRELKFIDSKFFPAIGIVSFAFVCHHACFIVYNTLRNNTNERWAKTVHMSLGTALGVMLTLAMAAYLTFRGIMNGNFLTNYSYTDELVNVMRCMFAITQTLTYPLELFVTRHAVHALVFPKQKWTDKQHYMITLLLWSSSLAIALNVSDLGVVLELTGGVSAVFIGFVLPGLLNFKINGTNSGEEWRLWKLPNKVAGLKKWGPSYFIIGFGALAMSLTVITLGGDLLFGEGHGPHDAYADGNEGLSDIDHELGIVKTSPTPTASLSPLPSISSGASPAATVSTGASPFPTPARTPSATLPPAHATARPSAQPGWDGWDF